MHSSFAGVDAQVYVSYENIGCYYNGEWGAGNENREQENVEWEQNRESEMKLLIGLGFELGFVPIFHFPVPRIGSPLPVLVTSENVSKRKFKRVNCTDHVRRGNAC